MSTQGKIKTLFSDKEKTEALFPRTKINAVSDENGKGLNAILNDMAYVGDITEDVVSTPVNADLLGGRPAGEYATQNYVANEIAKAQLEGEDVDLSGYATKDEMNAAIRAIDFPVDSVNGRTGAITLNASDVGAHPDTWLPTIAEIGAAPAGYGLGTNHLTWVSPNSLDSIIVPGWYHYYGQATTLNGFKFNHASLFVYPYEMDPFACVQEIRPYATSIVLRRLFFNNVWREWECENPPMELGVEYRTTEKHWSDAVYKKLIYIGKLPNSTEATFESLLSGVADVVSYQIITNASGKCFNRNDIVTEIGHSGDGYVWMKVKTDVNLSAYNGYLTVAYTKS